MVCNKKNYQRKRKAQEALNAAQKNRRLKYKPRRVYECDECLGWHITKNISLEGSRKYREKYK